MDTIGIVAEYDPFHTGHSYLISASRQALSGDAAVVAVMSGNWVQRAHCALLDKWQRARLALLGGADLVLELPTVWATASAEGFAKGAVAILDATGVVDHLAFGSECGELSPLRRTADCLDGPDYRRQLRQSLGGGLSFAASRQLAVERLLGAETAQVLASPNNALGVEYLRALRGLDSQIVPMTIRRLGAAHGSNQDGRYVSASRLRRLLLEGDSASAAPYLPTPPTGPMARLHRCERAILSQLRAMTAQDWASIPDSGPAEGLPQRLERAGRQCRSLEEFLELAKTKRYARSRLKRLALRAYLQISAQDIPAAPPYLRVLGFNGRGRQLLREMKDRASLPILTKPAHAQGLDRAAQALFRLEGRCTDRYDLCLEQIPPPGREWTQAPAILE